MCLSFLVTLMITPPASFFISYGAASLPKRLSASVQTLKTNIQTELSTSHKLCSYHDSSSCASLRLLFLLFCLVYNWSFPALTACLLLLIQSWDVFFRNANAGAPPGAAYQSPLSLSAAPGLAAPQLSSLVGAQPNVEKLVEDHLAVQSLIRAYQV